MWNQYSPIYFSLVKSLIYLPVSVGRGIGLLKLNGIFTFLCSSHSWHGFTKNGPRRNIAQLWKLFSYITIRIWKFLSGILFLHYWVHTIGLFLLQAHSILPKPRAFNPAQKWKGTRKFYHDPFQLHFWTNKKRVDSFSEKQNYTFLIIKPYDSIIILDL